MSDYTLEKKRQILKGYLREFYVKVEPKVMDVFNKLDLSPSEHNYFVCGPAPLFRRLGSYYLLREGRKDWLCFNSYYLVEVFLGKFEEYASIFDINQPYVIITHGLNEMPNAQKWNLLNQYLSWRINERKTFLVYGFERRALAEFKDNVAPEVKSAIKFIDLFGKK